jgi:hypothetical protein
MSAHRQSPIRMSGDPAEPVMASLLEVADKIERLLSDARGQAAVQVARNVATELPGAVDRLVLQRYRRMVVAVVVFGLVACCGSAGVGYWLRGAPPELQCADQAGGARVCWTWVRTPVKS